MVDKQRYAFLSSPRCGAKTRRGGYCNAPAVNRKKRCRMHGGAEGSGAPKGNNNALKHGMHTAEAILQRVYMKKLIKSAQNFLNDYCK